MVQSTTATTFRCDAPARTRFCAHFALVCLSCPSRRLLTSPSYRISGTPHAGATASDVAHTPAYIRGTNAAAIAAVGGLYGVAAAFFWRFCSARNYAACFACVLCGVDFGRWEPRATPARVRAAQARSGGGVQLHRGHREHGQSLGRAAKPKGVRSVDL
jgi:hypothetical protein